MSKTTVEECQKITISELKTHLYNAKSITVNKQTIFLTQTACNFGGWRYWFLCSTCNTKIGVLYRKPLEVHFLCRRCQNLVYQLTKYRRSKQEAFMKAIHKIKSATPGAERKEEKTSYSSLTVA